MARSAYTDGVIEVNLNGEDYELVASAKALKAINSSLGGFQRVIVSLQEGDVNVLESVFRAGLSRKEAEGLDDKIYKTGAISLVLPAIQFVMMLNNGGKHPDGIEEEEKTEKRPTRKATTVDPH